MRCHPLSQRMAMNSPPHDPYDLIVTANQLRQQGRLRDALLHCDAALQIDPHFVIAWLERGYAFASGGSMHSAADCYGQALACDPDCAPAHAGLASIAARDGDSPEGRCHALAALLIEPSNAVAAAALATMELESGGAAAARALVEPLVAAINRPDADRALLAGILGDACDRLGDVDAAYRAYVLCKGDFAELNAPLFAGRWTHREFVEQVHAGLLAMDPSGWRPGSALRPTGSAATHVFLLGYPRSGNTLMENILASIPGVCALEERPTLRNSDMEFLVHDAGLERLSSLNEAEVDPFRQAYWDKVVESGADLSGGAFVDMDPLKSLRLPLIARLFPDARVLIMRRDPRDVLWSCFHTNFALTNAAMEFTSLEATARHYDAMMCLIDSALEHLPLSAMEVHYHRLVQDFTTQTREICEFLQLPWTQELSRFDKTARTRGVSTASAGQVRKGLYDGTRQWQRYAHFLEPVMPILQPWIERFGYD